MDIMHINRIPFLVSKSSKILFCTAERLANRKEGTIAKAIKTIHQLYSMRRFKIDVCIMDGEFDVLPGTRFSSGAKDLSTMYWTR